MFERQGCVIRLADVTRYATAWMSLLSGLLLGGRLAVADIRTVDPRIVPGVANERLYQGEITPTLVTSSGASSPGTNVLSPSMTIPGFSGFSHEGVGRIQATGGGVTCTGGLLSTGRHMITAAHCFDHGAASWTANFDLATGTQAYGFSLGHAAIHPSYVGLGSGFDIAIVDLGRVVDAAIPRYDVVPGGSPDVFDAAHLRIGYGRSGDGTTGDVLPAGTKRWGLNRWESNGISGVVTNEATQLTYDYDSGAVAQDGFGFFFGTTGPAGAAGDPSFNDPVGEGADEVLGALGDSGGPVFVDDGDGNVLIAGVASYVARLVVASVPETSDLDSSINSSFGEFGGDTRLAHPDVASFVQTVTAVPEASPPLTLTFVGLGCWVFYRCQSIVKRRLAIRLR